MSYPQVIGYCPSCGGNSLFFGDGGHVTCSRLDCREPDAADRILADRETQHIVEFRAAEFTVRHPLIERVGDRLMDCRLHAYIAELSGPPVRLGRYRAWPIDTSADSISLEDVRHPWHYEALDGGESA